MCMALLASCSSKSRSSSHRGVLLLQRSPGGYKPCAEKGRERYVFGHVLKNGTQFFVFFFFLFE